MKSNQIPAWKRRNKTLPSLNENYEIKRRINKIKSQREGKVIKAKFNVTQLEGEVWSPAGS